MSWLPAMTRLATLATLTSDFRDFRDYDKKTARATFGLSFFFATLVQRLSRLSRLCRATFATLPSDFAERLCRATLVQRLSHTRPHARTHAHARTHTRTCAHAYTYAPAPAQWGCAVQRRAERAERPVGGLLRLYWCNLSTTHQNGSEVRLSAFCSVRARRPPALHRIQGSHGLQQLKTPPPAQARATTRAKRA